MTATAMFYPGYALFLLTVLVLCRSAFVRVSALKKKEIRMSYFRHFSGSDVPETIQVHSRNFVNLMELPTLFYVISIIIVQKDIFDPTYYYLAWGFTISRYIHSIIHLHFNNVNIRFGVYTVGLIILITMWTRVLFQAIG